MKKIIALLVLLSAICFAVDGIETTASEEKKARSNYYLSFESGVAFMRDPSATIFVSGNFNIITKSSRFFQVRSSFLGLFSTELIEQVGLLMGRSNNHKFYHVNYGVGLSIIEVWNGEGEFFNNDEDAVLLKRTVGVPFTIDFTGKLYLIGAGISINGNLNLDKPFIALGIKYSLGKLF